MAALSRTLGIFSGFVAVVAAAFYPIYFRPLLLPEEYSESGRGGAGLRCGGSAGGRSRAAAVLALPPGEEPPENFCSPRKYFKNNNRTHKNTTFLF